MTQFLLMMVANLGASNRKILQISQKKNILLPVGPSHVQEASNQVAVIRSTAAIYSGTWHLSAAGCVVLLRFRMPGGRLGPVQLCHAIDDAPDLPDVAQCIAPGTSLEYGWPGPWMKRFRIQSFRALEATSLAEQQSL